MRFVGCFCAAVDGYAQLKRWFESASGKGLAITEANRQEVPLARSKIESMHELLHNTWLNSKCAFGRSTSNSDQTR